MSRLLVISNECCHQVMLLSVMLSPRGQSGLEEAKILASASELWPWPQGFGLGLASISLSYYVIRYFCAKIVGFQKIK